MLGLNFALMVRMWKRKSNDGPSYMVAEAKVAKAARTKKTRPWRITILIVLGMPGGVEWN
jgi:hypothetical protein